MIFTMKNPSVRAKGRARNDGKVTFQEFEKFFENDNERFKAADLDKNGKLTHDEYHKLFAHGS
jgi:hypothetical protein